MSAPERPPNPGSERADPPAVAEIGAREGTTSASPATSEETLRRELKLAKERLDDITRLVSDWIWEVDRDLRITTVTPRIMEVLGYHPVELEGRPLADLVGDVLPMTAPTGSNRARPFRDREVRVRDRRGAWRMLRLSGLPVFDDHDGRFLGYRGTAQDVTELRARETALLEAKTAAEESNRTKSEFLAQMSHELRTPLNAIIGFSEVMELEQLGPLGVPQYRDYASDILNSAHHLSQVINDVLDVAKLEAGKFQLKEAACCPQDLTSRAVRTLQPRADDAGVTLVLAGAAADCQLFADAPKLLQILLNLLSNGVKFTPRGGRVEIAARPSDAGGFLFEITDTGIGMSEEDKRVALSPFGQVDSSLARRYEGTGLGLPLSKALAELHHGTLTIESTPGAGTRVTVHLPAERIVAPD